jgi:uncharacterized membrane protein YkoI
MQTRSIIFSLIAVAGTAGLLWTGLTTADAERGGHEAEQDQETAQRLTQQGDILPLERILEQARQHRDGRILETELEREYGRYLYEIELLDETGRVYEMKFDAATGELIKEELED